MRQLQILLLQAIRQELLPVLAAQQTLVQAQMQLQELHLQLLPETEKLLLPLRELQLEILQSMQPDPVQEISRLIGLPTQQR